MSLNNVLLTGPDLINNLLGVLLRFRKDEYAVTADIEQMFYSFFVRDDHRDYLRFFWYQDNNPDKYLVEYRMRVHVFGNSPSPAVATYGLRRAVENADSDIKNFVNNNFYVDDALTSLPTTQQAVNLIQRTQKALKENGNIRLHKIASNIETILNAFKPEDLSKDLKSLELGQDVLPTQRSLGLAWNLQLDTFTFNIELEDKPYTRRGVLSIVNSLFDPMGFIAPVIIHGKHLLREMIAHGTDWDQPLLPEHETEWIEWKNSLEILEDLTIPRMYIHTSVSTTDNIELHLYSDASEKAISAVAYIRTVNPDGTADIGFVMGKSRLSPQLGHTIPRLELCAAVMAVEIAETIHDNLDINLSFTKFYTDSKVVLGYINNQSRRFYTYVSNRVDRILQSTKPEQWNYVCTDKNPADQGSRCLSTTSIKDSMWLLGPTQLHRRDDCIPLESCHTLVTPELDKEIRPEVRVIKTNIVDNFSSRFHKFSSWTRLVNAISYLKRVAQYRKSKGDIQPRSIELYQEAENYIIRLVQQSFYSEELKCLQDNKPIPRNSNLRQFDPILDGESILRIGGRLNKSNLSKELKNPVIIPGKSHIASLLVTHYHQQVQHQGRHFTEGNIRSNGYWITGAKRLISTILHQCFKCRKLRGTLEYQKMADLPVDRLTPGPPFTSVGVDTFVTRRTRGGAANSKRWAIIFSCLTTRAIHIEVVEELSSSAFINALRRFIALRGDVKEFRSDRGTNFVGATNDLQIDTINVEDNPVKDFLFNNGTVWIFNAPHSSHMGGAWERMIGVTRKILDSMLIDLKYLTHDVLTTLMAEVCAIINARPISTISSDPESPEILSPALLLTQKVGVKPVSTENFTLTNIYRSQWKQVQMLSDIFWKQWKDGYLQSLQQRRKWNDDRPNVKTGDVILLKDKEVHRNEWPLGVVTNVIPSDDGKIRKVEVRITKDGKPTKYTRPINEVVVLIN